MRLVESLQRAIRADDSEQVSKLLSGSNSREVANALSEKSEDKWSVLMKAAGGGNVNIVNALLAARAQVDDHVAGITPLMVACMQAPTCSAAEVVSTLLEAKANPNVVDSYRETCLMKAAARGLVDVLHFLIKAGAHVNARDNNEHAAVYHAAKAGHVAAVKCLIQSGADEEAKNDALDIAETKELREVIEILKPDSMKPEEELPVVLPERYAFSKKVLSELPIGDGRVGFPNDVFLLLSGVGQSHYAATLLGKGFGVAQLIIAKDQELRDAGVRFKSQRRDIMKGMVKLAKHGWGRACIPEVNSILSAVHATCNAVRQIHIMWATTVLGLERGSPDSESDPHLNEYFATEVIRVTKGIVLHAEEIRRRAAIVAFLAKRKMWTDPVAPADLLCHGA